MASAGTRGGGSFRPTQQRAGAPSGAPGLLLCQEAGVPPALLVVVACGRVGDRHSGARIWAEARARAHDRLLAGSSGCRHGRCPASGEMHGRGRSRCPALAAPPAFPSRERPGAGQYRRVSLTCSFHSPSRRARLDSTSLGDAASYGLSGCLDAVLDVKLGEDPGDVVGDGVRAQGEVSCDLVVALAASELLGRSRARGRSGQCGWPPRRWRWS
jgi:hypothetical protein